MNVEQFLQALEQKDINLNNRQIEQFSIYFETLVEWNEKVNLTALTEKEDVYLKHFYDCITPSFYVDFEQELTICDVGAGAGFPSIPLKICFPEIKVTIVDSLKKRIDFLNHLARTLELEDVTFHHSRAEDFGQHKTFRENFDIVIARAVARMSVLSEFCLPLTKQGGLFIAMKGAQADEELNDARRAIERLGGDVRDNHVFTLPREQSERSIITIDKVKQTPKKYPRKAGTPNRHPIT